ncbi:hypothetical protein Lal_00011281 [Lupinus albus]|nr:hypothetical protein Lal_00011281 [Lupinus albus]
MVSQNDENEQGTMIFQISQKHTPRGVIFMKNVIRARSKNVKLTVEWNTYGQPCYNKGGNTLATFDVGEDHKDYIIKTAGKALRQFRTDAGKYLKDANENKISEENCKRASNPLYPYRASRIGYRGVEEKILEQSETPSASSSVDLDVLWVDVRKDKQDFIDNEQIQEVVDRVITLKERESLRTVESQVEIINNCKLFLEIPCTRELAIGTVYNTRNVMLHNAQIPSNHVRVSIDISIEDDALLPIPLDENTQLEGL